MHLDPRIQVVFTQAEPEIQLTEITQTLSTLHFISFLFFQSSVSAFPVIADLCDHQLPY